MKVSFFDTHRFEREFFERAATGSGHEFQFFDTRLTMETAPLARGSSAICSFVSDVLNASTIALLAECGVQLIALRSAGFNHVDLRACKKWGIKVVRVPAYSPHAVAEHALALILCLNRKLHRAYDRIRQLNFSLDGLVGFDLVGKTVGVIGTGTIGGVFTRIMHGLGCRVIAFDPHPRPELSHDCGVSYVALDELFASADIISLHVPLLPETRHLINGRAIAAMKPGVMIINTGRGALIDTKALIDGLKSGKIGAAGLDVYEEEEGVFFHDLSNGMLPDDLLARLLTFPQVLITAHQGFLTREALQSIALTTVNNITEFEQGQSLTNEVPLEK